MPVRPDVVSLREFYLSPLGQWVRRVLGDAILTIWPELKGDTLIGIGYANPFLRRYLRQEREASDILSLMPATQGATVWPHYGGNRAVLHDTEYLPVADNHANRILLIHALEHAEDPRALLSECWRVLVPGGRMLVVVPNRLGGWCRSKRTPFSKGQAMRGSEMRELVCEHFTHIHTRTALFLPPLRFGLLRNLRGATEIIGRGVLPFFGGVWVMEVEKQIYAGVTEVKRSHPARAAFRPIGSKPALSREPARHQS